LQDGINADDLAASTAAPWDFARLITLYLETDLKTKAETAIADGRRVFEKHFNSPDYLLQFELARARVEAATGKSAAAAARAQKARQEAERMGLAPLVLELESVTSRAAAAR
jgi:hypothetical protein